MQHPALKGKFDIQIWSSINSTSGIGFPLATPPTTKQTDFF